MTSLLALFVIMDKTDEELIEFYLKEKEESTDIFRRFQKERLLKQNPLYADDKLFWRQNQIDILKDPENAHLRKANRMVDE